MAEKSQHSDQDGRCRLTPSVNVQQKTNTFRPGLNVSSENSSGISTPGSLVNPQVYVLSPEVLKQMGINVGALQQASSSKDVPRKSKVQHEPQKEGIIESELNKIVSDKVKRTLKEKLKAKNALIKPDSVKQVKISPTASSAKKNHVKSNDIQEKKANCRLEIKLKNNSQMASNSARETAIIKSAVTITQTLENPQCREFHIQHLPVTPKVSESSNMETASFVKSSIIFSPGEDISNYTSGYNNITNINQAIAFEADASALQCSTVNENIKNSVSFHNINRSNIHKHVYPLNIPFSTNNLEASQTLHCNTEPIYIKQSIATESISEKEMSLNMEFGKAGGQYSFVNIPNDVCSEVASTVSDGVYQSNHSVNSIDNNDFHVNFVIDSLNLQEKNEPPQLSSYDFQKDDSQFSLNCTSIDVIDRPVELPPFETVISKPSTMRSVSSIKEYFYSKSMDTSNKADFHIQNENNTNNSCDLTILENPNLSDRYSSNDSDVITKSFQNSSEILSKTVLNNNGKNIMLPKSSFPTEVCEKDIVINHKEKESTEKHSIVVCEDGYEERSLVSHVVAQGSQKNVDKPDILSVNSDAFLTVNQCSISRNKQQIKSTNNQAGVSQNDNHIKTIMEYLKTFLSKKTELLSNICSPPKQTPKYKKNIYIGNKRFSNRNNKRQSERGFMHGVEKPGGKQNRVTNECSVSLQKSIQLRKLDILSNEKIKKSNEDNNLVSADPSSECNASQINLSTDYGYPESSKATESGFQVGSVSGSIFEDTLTSQRTYNDNFDKENEKELISEILNGSKNFTANARAEDSIDSSIDESSYHIRNNQVRTYTRNRMKRSLHGSEILYHKATSVCTPAEEKYSESGSHTDIKNIDQYQIQQKPRSKIVILSNEEICSSSDLAKYKIPISPKHKITTLNEIVLQNKNYDKSAELEIVSEPIIQSFESIHQRVEDHQCIITRQGDKLADNDTSVSADKCISDHPCTADGIQGQNQQSLTSTEYVVSQNIQDIQTRISVGSEKNSLESGVNITICTDIDGKEYIISETPDVQIEGNCNKDSDMDVANSAQKIIHNSCMDTDNIERCIMVIHSQNNMCIEDSFKQSNESDKITVIEINDNSSILNKKKNPKRQMKQDKTLASIKRKKLKEEIKHKMMDIDVSSGGAVENSIDDSYASDENVTSNAEIPILQKRRPGRPRKRTLHCNVSKKIATMENLKSPKSPIPHKSSILSVPSAPSTLPTPTKKRMGRPKKYPYFSFNGKLITCAEDELHGTVASSTPRVIQNMKEYCNEIVKCAECLKEMKRKQWASHNLHTHKNLAWLDGEDAVDVENKGVYILGRVLKILKKLVCNKCGDSKASAVGYLSHIAMCSKTKEEIESLRQPCPVCHRFMLPQSLKVHLPTHSRFQYKKEMEAVQEVPLDHTPDGVRKKRKAAEKAGKTMQIVKSEDVHMKKLNKMFAKPPLLLIRGTLRKTWERQENHGHLIYCPRQNCLQSTLTIAEMSEHYLKACSSLPSQMYTCTQCKHESSNEKDIRKHVRNQHKDLILLESDDDESFHEDSDNGDHLDSEDEYELEEDPKKRGKGQQRRSHNSHKGQLANMPPNFCFLRYPDRLPEDYKNWTDQFMLENNYNKPLYPDMKCNPVESLSMAEAERFLPEERLSCRVAHSLFSPKALDPYKMDIQWKQFKLFESNVTNGSCTLWAGGVVRALDWVPGNRTLSYLALSSDRSMLGRYKEDALHKFESLIQIWDFGDLNNDPGECTHAAEMVFGMAHSHGVVWEMEWCPSGCADDCREDGKGVEEQQKLPRMGLLAVACSDGMVHIYAIPNPTAVTKNESRIYHTDPAASLQLSEEGSLNIGRFPVQPTKLFWCKEEGHQKIVVGYSNGMIAYFDISGKSSLLKSKKQNTVLILPFHTFQPYTTNITGLVLVPLRKQDKARFPVVGVTSASGCGMWCGDTEIVSKRGRFSNAMLCPHWPQFYVCTEEFHTSKSIQSGYCTVVLAMSARCAGVRDLPVGTSREVACGAAGAPGPWGGTLLTATSSGELSLQPIKTPLLSVHRNGRHNKKKKALISYPLLVDLKGEFLKRPPRTFDVRPSNIIPTTPITNFISDAGTYEKAAERYGILYVDVPFWQSPKLDPQGPGPEQVAFDRWPLQATLTAKPNPEFRRHRFLAHGGRSGHVRVTCARHLRGSMTGETSKCRAFF